MSKKSEAVVTTVADLEVEIKSQGTLLAEARSEMDAQRQRLIDLVAEFGELAMLAQKKQLRNLDALGDNERKQEQTRTAIRRAEAAANQLQAEHDRLVGLRDRAKFTEYTAELEKLESQGRALNRLYAEADTTLVETAQAIYLCRNEMRKRSMWIDGAGLRTRGYRQPAGAFPVDGLCRADIAPTSPMSGVRRLVSLLKDRPWLAGNK